MKAIFWLAASIWLAINVMTLTGYPAVWVDEILSADPGIHLALGKGFVSAAWFNQPSWEFWASYPPLYAFALAGWLKLFGISAFVVRSFGLTLVTASLLMIGLTLRRLGLDARWLILAALAVGEPLAFLERAGRPDSVSVFLLAATGLVFVSQEWRWRAAGLFLFGALAVPAALQYAAYVLLLGFLLQLWFRPFARKDVALWLAGVACGSASLALIYVSHGVLRIFVESTLASKHSSAGRLLQQMFLKNGSLPFVFSDILTAPLRDYATPILLLAGFIVWLTIPATRKLSSFGVVCAILIPLAIQLLGKYPIYYTYMAFIPAAIAIMAACRMPAARGAVVALLLVGGAGHLWWKAFTQGSENLAVSVSSSDSVVADYPAYYQLLGRTRELFAVGYAGGKVMPHFPPEQASRITKILVRESMFGDVAKKVGGSWRKVSAAKVTIDDDTRLGYQELLGIYVRSDTNPRGANRRGHTQSIPTASRNIAEGSGMLTALSPNIFGASEFNTVTCPVSGLMP